MSYLLKYKLLQSYLLNKNWHPGNFVPADYYRLKIGTLINDEKITIKNRASDTSIKNIGNNSKNLYYAISTSAIHNEDPNNFKNFSNIKWKQLVDGSITIGSKDFYSSVEKVYIYLTALYDINNIKRKSENMYRTRYRYKELDDNGNYEYIYTNSDSNTSYGLNKIYSTSDSAFTNIDIDLQILPSAPDSSRPETSLGTVIMPEGQFESLIFGTNPNHWTTEYIDNFCIYKNKVTTKQEIDKILEENFENLKDGNTARISIHDSLNIPVPRFTGSNFSDFKNVFNKRLYYCETYSNCNFYNNNAKLYIKPIGIHYRGILNGSNISELTIEFPEFDENLSYSYLKNSLSFNPKNWLGSGKGYNYFIDRFKNAGAFNTSTLKKININFNDANTDLSFDRHIYTYYWHMCTDFIEYKQSYMFEGINKNATIYINSLLAPMMDDTAHTSTCIPLPNESEYNGKIFLKDYYTVSGSKKYTDWYYMLSRKTISDTSHYWYDSTDATMPLDLNYYLYNYWAKIDEYGTKYGLCNPVFYVKNDDYDGVNDTKQYFTLPLSGEFYLKLSNSGIKYKKAIVNTGFEKTDYTSGVSSWTWEDFVTLGTDSKYSNHGMNSYISAQYTGDEFPINKYYVDVLTSAGDTGYGEVIGIGTAKNYTQIGNSSLKARGTGGYVNHIYINDSTYGISGSNKIEFGKTYYINESDSINYLNGIN